MAGLAELRRISGALRCLECGKCSTLCPLSTFGEFSVMRMAAIHDPGSDLVAHSALVNRCLTCGSCEIRCPQGVRFTQFVRGVRQAMPVPLRTPCPHGGVMQAAARLSASSNGALRDLSWIGEGLRVSESGEVALFVGCASLFDIVFEQELGSNLIEVARSAIRLLNAAGIEPVIAANERCCGHDLLWGGEREVFHALAEANAKAFQSRGVKHIVTACAECCRTWRVDYADEVPSYQPRVEHVSEFATRMVESGALVFDPAAPARVTYQDPCRLARHLGVVDAPRSVLAAMPGAELHEMELSGADARCCGTSGFNHCDRDSRRMQDERLRSAEATGAEVLLTACPKCWLHLSCAGAEDRLRHRQAPRIRVEDITVFAAQRLALRPAPPAPGPVLNERSADER